MKKENFEEHVPLKWLKITTIMSEIILPYEERINKMLNVLI